MVQKYIWQEIQQDENIWVSSNLRFKIFANITVQYIQDVLCVIMFRLCIRTIIAEAKVQNFACAKVNIRYNPD